MTHNPNNPILHSEELRRFDLRRKRRVPSADTAIVYTDSRGRTFIPGRPLTTSEAVFGQLRLYEVDLAEHPASFACELPSAEEAFSFRAQVSLTWQVHDARAVVQRRVEDAAHFYSAHLVDRMRTISRRHEIEHSADAEVELNADLGSGSTALDQGIKVTGCRVQITLDAAARAHVAERTNARRAIEQADLDAKVRLARAATEHATQLNKTEQDLAATKGEHELAQLREVQRQELETQRAQHENKLKEQRMRFYLNAIEQGNGSLLVLYLTENPADIGAVMNYLLQDREIAFKNDKEILRVLADSGLLNGADVDPARRVALDNILTRLQAPAASISAFGKKEPDAALLAAASSRDDAASRSADVDPAARPGTDTGGRDANTITAEIVENDDDEPEY